MQQLDIVKFEVDMLKSLLVATPLVLVGCATVPAQPEITWSEAAQVVVQNKRSLFKDPDSVRDAALGQPYRGLFGSTRVCLRANAKNSFGGYTGINDQLLSIANGVATPLGPVGISDNCGIFIALPELNAK
jgi:hypothetical protein